MIYSGSLSSRQAIQSFDIINITLLNILKLYTQLTDMGKHVSLCWIPSHVGINVEIEPELFLVRFRPGTTSVQSGLKTFFVPEPEHAKHSLCF